MIVALIFVLSVITGSYGTADDDQLETVLNSSPNKIRAAFKKYVEMQNEEIPASKFAMRLKKWVETAKKVVAFNKDSSYGASFTAYNFLADKTEEEKKQYLGLNYNATDDSETPKEAEEEARLETRGSIPSQKDWLHATAPVKNQGSCGSCWSFGSTGAMETQYYILTGGTFRDFSEQELVDCVYGQTKDDNGCGGGVEPHAWKWIKTKNNGEIAAAADYPYEGTYRSCKADYKSNAAVAATVSSWRQLMDESSTIASLARGSLSISVEVGDVFQAYEYGILTDKTCDRYPDYQVNHAMVAVGYTPQYVLIENSWGSAWGDQGFLRMSRGYRNCNIYTANFDVTLKATGRTDTKKSDPTVNYKVNDNAPQPDSGCKEESWCNSSVDCSMSFYVDYCPKTCGACTQSCPGGTVKCSDGVCRHPHMC